MLSRLNMVIRRFWFPTLLVALALTARLVPGPRTIDDSYITFRYARNLLAGEGLTYNPGERVLGTTTPLYTGLMAGLGALTGGTQAPFPLLALWVNAMADAGTCLLLWQLGKKAGAPRAGNAAAIIWSVAPYSVTFAIGGLETSLYVFLLTAAFTAFLFKHHILSAACASLALLTRPDALLLVLPLLAARLLAWGIAVCAQKKISLPGWIHHMPGSTDAPPDWREALVFLMPVLAWYGFAWIYFGNPLPHSMQAKLIAYHLSPGDSFIRLLQHYATPFMEANLLGTAIAVGVGLVLYPFLFVVGARRSLHNEANWWIWIVYPWLYLIAFALPNPLIFRWYLTPPLPAYFFFILLGLDALLIRLFAYKAQTPAWRTAMVTWLVVLLPLIPILSDWRIHPDHGPQTPAPEMAFIKLELLYREAADFLAPKMTSQTLLAAGDVGVLGYYTPARILDTVGLNSPVSLNYYPLDEKFYVINYAIPSALILDQKPGYVVILEVYGRLTLLKDKGFLAQYELLRTLPTDLYGSQGMLIFQRRGG